MEERHQLVESEPLNPLSLRVEIAGSTDRGLVRPINEDSYVILQEKTVPSWCSAVVGIFDGVGGLANGQEASSRAARYLPELLRGRPLRRVPNSGLGQAVANLMLGLHSKLRADQRGEPALGSMASTGTIALLPRTFPTILWIGHVGDSPVLRLRAGSVQKLVEEDSLVAAMLRDGLIQPEQARHHPQRHVITQALGHDEEIVPHVSAHQVYTGDCYLLCTDGLTGMLPEAAILEIAAGKSPQAACRDLITAANTAGGFDNITVVIMQF
jgi:protein phosphatase